MAPRILIVEDDPVSREIIASLLASRGYETDAADDGFGALRMAQEANYDLVFIDYHLPEMDGYALARLMRSLGEKTNAKLKMVAITADQFGLAARRGVDKIFDRVLSKPIEPDRLYDFVDEFLREPASLETLQSFLAPEASTADDASSPSLSLWRARGIDRLPAAAVFPTPTSADQARILQCFRIVEPQQADCLILLHAAGLADLAALRREGPAFLQPLIVTAPELATIADAYFEPGAGESWSRVAHLIRSFSDRRSLLASELTQTGDLATRVAAYMHAADRSLDLVRGATGETIVPYTAGFASFDLIDAVKQLAARSLVTTRLEPIPDGDRRRLTVTLSEALSRQASGAIASAKP